MFYIVSYFRYKRLLVFLDSKTLRVLLDYPEKEYSDCLCCASATTLLYKTCCVDMIPGGWRTRYYVAALDCSKLPPRSKSVLKLDSCRDMYCGKGKRQRAFVGNCYI